MPPLADGFLSGFLGFAFFLAIMAMVGVEMSWGARTDSAPAPAKNAFAAGVRQPSHRPTTMLERDHIPGRRSRDLSSSNLRLP